ncbi:hypothetical protein PIB30_033256 [Stylosanthes scabra]|uniref:Uncharacterized protein n=1 Tax=Stylosanthes scabra TaxID=79078 RepID=A0ABU6YB98_9FABA|nr:hypothetical protein [Stylosanthes scabra]
MPFELYETLDLGSLKKTKEVFTTADASIVSVTAIAENVLVRIGELTISANFHIIKPTKREKKGGTPQVLLGRSFLKTAEFKLIYYDEIFTFSVGSAIETFHLTPPPNLQKKGIHQLQMNNGRTQGGSSKEEKKTEAKFWKGSRGRAHDVASDNSLASKGKKKKVVLNPEKKKKKKELDGSNVKKDPKKKKKELNEDESERKKPIKCSSFSRLLGRLKVLKDVLCRNKTLRASQPIDKVGPSNSTPAMPDPIVISSDSEEDREKDPKGSNFEEEDPEMDPEE